MAMLDLHCCSWAFSSCSEHGLLFSCGAQASYCGGFSCCGAQALAWTGFSSCSFWALEHRLNSCGARAQWLRTIWNPPRSGTEPVSPALAGRFFTTEPPGKSIVSILIVIAQNAQVNSRKTCILLISLYLGSSEAVKAFSRWSLQIFGGI